jgi:hypothetical protein
MGVKIGAQALLNRRTRHVGMTPDPLDHFRSEEQSVWCGGFPLVREWRLCRGWVVWLAQEAVRRGTHHADSV